MNGPGACRNPGSSFDPVNAPQSTNRNTIDTTDATLFETTALSSPKVTVLREA